MATRRPNLANAGVELGFVGVAIALGAFGAPVVILAALIVVMIGYWVWSRWRSLATMSPGALIGSSVLSIGLLGAVLAGAFFGARTVTGWMTP